MSNQTQRLKFTQLAASIALVAGGAAFVPAAYAVAPAAGTNISNIASASYIDSNNSPKTVTSNEVKTTVLQVSSFTLVDDRTANANPNGQVSLSHTLTNTGNGSDSYKLEIEQLASDNFNLDNIRIYIDKNKDGQPDDNIDLTGQTVSLASGESVGLIIVSAVPATQTAGSAKYTLTATSQFDTSDTEMDTDTVTIVAGAVMQVQKAASVSTITDNGVITYTLTYKNTGNAAAQDVVILDNLDTAKVSYVPDSAIWSGSGSTMLTDADLEAQSNGAIRYEYKNGKVTVVLTNVAANTTGTIKFSVTAIASNTANISNTAQIYDGEDNDNDPLTVPIVPTGTTQTPSNETIVERTKTYKGTINDSIENAFADRVTVTGFDDKIEKTTTQGTAVVFGIGANQEPIVIHNTGNTTEVYNITTILSTLPTGSTVELFKADGNTPLTDTNNDGIKDTGPIAPGAIYQIVAKITLPSTFKDSNGTETTNDVTLRIAPVSDSAALKDTLKLSIIDVTPATVDLFNGDATDNTTDPITGATGHDTGQYIDIITVEPGSPAYFPLTVQNNGANADNFNLSNSVLPSGWTVQYFKDNGSGQPTGAPLTNTGNINGGGSTQLVAVVTPSANAAATGLVGQEVIFTVTSPATNLSDKMSDKVIVDENRILSLQSDNTGQIAPGGTVIYKHTLTNSGNLTEGDAVGELPVSLTGTINGWISSVYVDLDGNGEADSNELITDGDLYSKLPAGLAPGASIGLIIKVEAPANATAGTQHSAVLTISPTVIGGDAVTVLLSNTDLTTVNDGQVRLVKEQAPDIDCDGNADIAYTQNTISAKPGQCVKYKITATNEGNVGVTNVVISDSTPAYTTLKVIASASPVATNATLSTSTAALLDGSTGTVTAEKTPLVPNTSAVLEFVIKVNN